MRKISARAILFILTVGLSASLALAAGDAAQGKKLFNDPGFSGSSNARSCNSCHPGGKGLEGVAGKTAYQSPAGSFGKLKSVVNQCIVKALAGKPLPENSTQMQDLIAYIRTL